MGEQRNFILAISLSMLVIFGYQYIMPAPEPVVQPEAVEDSIAGAAPEVSDSGVPTLQQANRPELSIDDAINAENRVIIDSTELQGSISLTGLLIDDIVLRNHKISLEEGADNIRIFNPAGTENAYFGRFGWAPVPNQESLVPTAKTVWTADREVLSEDSPVTMTWDNGAGQVFSTKISVDEKFLFTIEQSVTSTDGADAILLAPYGLISRKGVPETMDYFILHEGLLGVFDGILATESWSDMEDNDIDPQKGVQGWLGMTDKYWLSALIPATDSVMDSASFNYVRDRFQVTYLEKQDVLTLGGTLTSTSHIFAGAKLVNVLEHYEEEAGFVDFTKAVDWGWFNFLTRPFFWLLHYLYEFSGNFGVAILLLTVIIKGAMFPIANKGFRSMSRMKKVAPKLKKLQERYKEDKPKLQQEMMALYAKEKINPLSGCFPILIQIPVFFALYKVLFVTIEMRHQPFFGWIQDLSAPDPMAFINLFGLLPFDPPSFLAIGIWPVLMGISMWLQQKLSPQPTDPTQQAVMKWLPVIFTFILGQFAAGLVIYWTWNNILTITQQWVIMRREGVSINQEEKS